MTSVSATVFKMGEQHGSYLFLKDFKGKIQVQERINLLEDVFTQ